VRQTLTILQEYLPEMSLHEVPTGTKCFDWVVPKEWVIRDAYIKTPSGETIARFCENNLHVVNYSAPINRTISMKELQPHLHSLPHQPDAIPYVTCYYKESWGFCITDRLRKRLSEGTYQVYIDSELKSGSLSYGELYLPGKTIKEILISTYVCHPSLANNELSGPCVTAELAAWLQKYERQYSYRVIFIPETIGSIYYLSRHLKKMKKNTIAGYVVTCVGDERAWSYLPSRDGNTLSDRVARHVLQHAVSHYKEYPFTERGSDERQYCSPGVDLPIASIMRSKYDTYPEYHTSYDNLSFVTSRGLGESLFIYKKILEVIESNTRISYRVLCEPKMSDRGLRETTGKRGSANSGRVMMNLLAYADGNNTLLNIAEKIGEPVWNLYHSVKILEKYKLIKIKK